MLFSQPLGIRIKYFRNKKGYTQKQLAEKVGINDSTIRNYELGNRTPDISKLKEIAQALQIDIYSLIIPDATNVHGAIHALFRLEDFFGFVPEQQGDKTVIVLDSDNVHPYYYENEKQLKVMEDSLDCWYQARKSLKGGFISNELYDTWKSKFPSFSTINQEGTPIVPANENIKKTMAEEQLKSDYKLYLSAKDWAGESDVISFEEFSKRRK